MCSLFSVCIEWVELDMFALDTAFSIRLSAAEFRPLLVISGSYDPDQSGMGGFQEFPQVGLIQIPYIRMKSIGRYWNIVAANT